MNKIQYQTFIQKKKNLEIIHRNIFLLHLVEISAKKLKDYYFKINGVKD